MRIGTTCIAVSMVPMLLAVTIDFYLIAHIIMRDSTLSAALAALVGASFVGLWYGLPWAMRAARRRAIG